MRRIIACISIAMLALPMGWAWAGEPVPTEVLKRSRQRPADEDTYGIYVTDKVEYAYQWKAFGYKSDRPPVNFRRRAVVFVAYHESGSCPLHFERTTVNREERRITVRFDDGAGPNEACTDDWNPRSFVLSLRRASLPPGDLKVRVWRV